MEKTEVSIIIPVYNEAKTLPAVLEDLLQSFGRKAEIIVINDGSSDETAQVIKRFPMVRSFEHSRNYGYGYAVKTGIRRATTNLLCLFDGDGQYRGCELKRLLDEYRGEDMLVGARGMSAYRHIMRAPGKIILHMVANFLAGQHIPDLNSGLRVIRRDVILRYLHLLPDGFSASTTMTMIFLTRKYDVRYIPVIAGLRVGQSQVRYFQDGINTVILILRVIMLFNPMKFFLMLSTLLIGLGSVYGSYKLFTNHQGGFPVGALLIISTGMLCFVVGLLADQVSQLRMERFEMRDYLKKETEG